MATKHRPEHHSELQVESPMDYAQHEATYNGFLAGVKYGIVCMAILLVGLYFAIIADQAGVGFVLIFASVIVPVVMAVMSRK
ncbi:aa3-type cytochrome c oxidase subunit IV [Devosia sp. 2618]|uniref:aa3-type cytochrome c oxidase subunit IV n=1 Tax=Devosia sp. 2618 TaxID=3156454 RepID=UPI003397B731